MRIFFDTEFIDDGRRIELMSIGLVRDDGAHYCADVADANRSGMSDWVARNVLPNMTGPSKARSQIARELVGFCGEDPEFWGYYAAYDWVALCQLYGRMLDLPPHWPKFVRDLRSVFDVQAKDFAFEPDVPHNALSDARWIMAAYRKVTNAPPTNLSAAQ